MRAHDAAYDAAIAAGYQFAARLELLDQSTVVASSEEDSDTELLLVGGSVIADRTADHRRTFNAQLAMRDGSLIPNQGDDLLSSVGGREVRIQTGLWIPGESEPRLFDQGIFSIDEPESNDTRDELTLTLRGTDRSARVAAGLLTAPKVISNGEPILDQAAELITDAYSAAIIERPSNPETGVRMVLDVGTDPWKKSIELVRAIGFETYVQPYGSFVFQVEPDPTTATPVWEYREDVGVETPQATFIRINRRQSSRQAYNGYIVIGENTFGITPARGIAWDDDPDSPTYYLGTYGRRPAPPETSKIAHTQAQVNAAALAGLRRVLGASEVVTWSAVANPALEEGDVVRLQRGRSNIDSALLIDRIVFSLSTGAMECTSRERRLT